MNNLKTMVENQTVETTNANLIEEAKVILRLASPGYDLRKNDNADILLTDSREAALQRGVASVVNISIGKRHKHYFESWLANEIVNPIIIVRDTHFIIKGNEDGFSADWDAVTITGIKSDKGDKRYDRYGISLTIKNRDYQISMRINKQLEEYWWYAR